MSKIIQFPTMNYLLTNYQNLDEVSWLLRQEKQQKTNILKTLENIANLLKKFLKFEQLHCRKQMHWTNNQALPFYNTVKKVFWHLRRDKISKTDKNFRKPQEKLQILF